MATERINGIKLNFDTLTDDELRGVIDHQLERFYHVEKDLNTAIGYAALRGLLPEPSDACEVISLDDYRQGALFDVPDGAA